MKWFRHFSDASNDEFIADLEDEFGLEGYARWWKMLEVIALQMDETDKCSAAYPEKKWCRKLQCKPKVLARFLERTNNERKTRVEQNGNIMEIFCPKLLELRDNYSRNLQATRRPTVKQEVEVEVEVNKSIIKPKKVSKKNKSPLPENFTISDRVYKWAKENNHNPTTDDVEAFSLHHQKVGSMFVDWDSAFMLWMRNKLKFNKGVNDADGPRSKPL